MTFHPQIAELSLNLKSIQGLLLRTEGVTVFISNDDELSVVKTVDILKKGVAGLEIRQYVDKGHFTLGDLGTTAFPELLEEVTTERSRR